ncbi:MAG: helix-turn-helix transcriptional regulator [Candidatus Bathyarchaeota archaeon]|nr:MAG: helix-turn-helix transcriptional regulator [Candidatus Bathyarchaeota archaeon]
MHTNGDHVCFCPIKGVIDVISKKWALLIVNAIGNEGPLRFNKIMDALHSISPKTLSDTLKDLVAEGLLKRTSFAEIPPRVEYSLTKDGEDFRHAIIPLLEWAASRNNHCGRKCVPIYRSLSAHRIKRTERKF